MNVATTEIAKEPYTCVGENILFILMSIEKNILFNAGSVGIIIFYDKMNRKRCYHQINSRWKIKTMFKRKVYEKLLAWKTNGIEDI